MCEVFCRDILLGLYKHERKENIKRDLESVILGAFCSGFI
jgi:hypothetical protein